MAKQFVYIHKLHVYENVSSGQLSYASGNICSETFKRMSQHM